MDGSNGVWTQPAGARPHPEFSGNDRAGGVHVTVVRRALRRRILHRRRREPHRRRHDLYHQQHDHMETVGGKTVRAKFARNWQGEWQINRFAVSDEA
jgi:hypothetical protein